MYRVKQSSTDKTIHFDSAIVFNCRFVWDIVTFTFKCFFRLPRYLTVCFLSVGKFCVNHFLGDLSNLRKK